jgi:hypothetical protein
MGAVLIGVDVACGIEIWDRLRAFVSDEFMWENWIWSQW